MVKLNYFNLLHYLFSMQKTIKLLRREPEKILLYWFDWKPWSLVILMQHLYLIATPLLDTRSLHWFVFIEVKVEGVVCSTEQSTGSSFISQLLKKYTEYRMLHI